MAARLLSVRSTAIRLSGICYGRQSLDHCKVCSIIASMARAGRGRFPGDL